MMSRIVLYLLCIFAIPVWAQFGSDISVEPKVGTIFFDQNLSNKYAMSYGIAFQASITDQFSTGISYKNSSAAQEILIPGNTIQFDTGWHILQLHLTYDMFNYKNRFFVSPAVGMGSIKLTTPAMTADLGALGEADIPARSATYFIFSPAVQAGIHVTNKITISIQPGLHIFTISEKRYLNYFIEGGLRIEL